MISEEALFDFKKSAVAMGYQSALTDVLMVITEYSREQPDFARNHARHLAELLKELMVLQETKCSQSLS